MAVSMMSTESSYTLVNSYIFTFLNEEYLNGKNMTFCSAKISNPKFK